MSLCTDRLVNGTKSDRRLHDSRVMKTLDYLKEYAGCDFEEGKDTPCSRWSCNLSVDSGGHNLSSTSLSDTPRSSRLWDSGIGSPTPKSCERRSPRDLSFRHLSPIPFSCGEDDSDGESNHKSVQMDDSTTPHSPYNGTPPHKKFTSLRLYDTPHTPKSLLKKAQRRMTYARRTSQKGARKARLVFDEDRPQTNINPFNSEDARISNLKRTYHFSESSILGDDSANEEMEEDLYAKKLPMHDINTSRYNEEFYEVSRLGGGNFGSVFRCIHRLDGCTYAIKKSTKPVAGSALERAAMNEVYAHAVLGKHQHVVRYYSAWAENDHMYIQNEYCNGGSLLEHLSERRANGGDKSSSDEEELKQILYQVAAGLRYIHSQHLVHLDIKPANIFVHCSPRLSNPESGLEEDITDDVVDEDETAGIIYKIGDLGHVASVGSHHVEEGDCRYLPREILEENYEHLPKADIFSLALTVYSAGSGTELPKNGAEWHAIRRGELPALPQVSKGFNDLLTSMVHADPRQRPSAVALTQHSVLCPLAAKTKAQLRKELNEERFKNEVLSRQLQEATQKRIQLVTRPPTESLRDGLRKRSRLVGGKAARSISLTCF